MIEAQARLYSDVKSARNLRLSAMAALGVVVSALAALDAGDTPVGGIGGGVLLLVNWLLFYRERRRTNLAASIQELFDCTVFPLEWNSIIFRKRPTGQEIASAAARYRGSRSKDWYPPTLGLARPLDVVVCQQSNIGWGAPVHRAWAWTVVGALGVSVSLIGSIWALSPVDGWEGFEVLVVPYLPLAWEALEMTRQNFESAREKEETHAQLLDDWAEMLDGNGVITESRCRTYQDEIAGVRKRNALVPDFFDQRLRGRNELAMRTTAEDLLAAADRAGFVRRRNDANSTAVPRRAGKLVHPDDDSV